MSTSTGVRPEAAISPEELSAAATMPATPGRDFLRNRKPSSSGTRGTLMQDRKQPISRRQAAREAKAGRGFLLWIALYAVLVVSLFAFNGGGPA